MVFARTPNFTRRAREAQRDYDSSSWLTFEEARAELRIGPKLLRRLIRDGDIHAVRLGSVWRIPSDGLEALRCSRRRDQAGEDEA